jgi:predicted TIM-barrel fold metal-dependent hydrolase
MPIFDCDVHPKEGPAFIERLPRRWRDYLDTVGRRALPSYGVTVPGKPGALRRDAAPPGGGPIGSDPDFAREQLLDEYDISCAVLNNIDVLSSGGVPVELELAIVSSMNDLHLDVWLASDPRWLASISISPDHEQEAVREIARCRERSDRFVQVLTSSKTERPAGNRKYWPIYEAAEDHHLPVAVHVGPNRFHQWTGLRTATYYYEMHVGNALQALGLVPSLIFEGVFDRFPRLRIALIELGWDWIVPYAWRLDASWRVLRAEVAHLERKPSEYLLDHFWFSTQPAVEPESPGDLQEVWDQFAGFGLADRLMFSSDYPHWDMDSPFESLPQGLSRAQQGAILYGNAAALYGASVVADTAT